MSTRDPQAAALATALADHGRRLSEATLQGADADTLLALTLARDGAERALLDKVEEKTPPVVTLEAVCDALPGRTSLVDFLRYGERYVAFVVNGRCEVARVDLGEAAPIDAAIAAWRGVMTSPEPSTRRVDGRGREVRERLWDPLLAHLRPGHAVLVVTDGAVATVPFSALPTDEGYLVQRWSCRSSTRRPTCSGTRRGRRARGLSSWGASPMAPS